jgi:hypothetical protein
MAGTIQSTIDHAHLILTGTSPLMLDNIESMNDENPLVIEMARALGGQRTPEDMARKARLHWQSRLYIGESTDGTLVLEFPTLNVHRSISSAARRGKKTAVENGISPTAARVPLHYDGPTTIDTLWEDKRFVDRRMVNGTPTRGKAMVPTTRPVFPQWSIELDFMVFNDVVGWDVFTEAVTLAGLGKGIGNARRLGCGRFTAQIDKV